MPKPDNKLVGMRRDKRGKIISPKDLSLIVNVRAAESHANRKVVMLESPLLLSNNTEFSLHMAKHWDKITEVDKPVPTESLKDEDKFQVFPNSVFKVPLVWIIEDYSLLYLTHRNN